MITPQTKELLLAEAVGVPTLYIKREDLHPYGSHKGRSIPNMIDHYLAQGIKRFAISSSGNAALAAAMHITNLSNKETETFLQIFIGQNIHPEKEARLREYEKESLIRINKVERPKQALIKLCNEDSSVKSLRQSLDDVALTGYHTLAKELLDIENLSAVFIATSSGTCAQGLHDIFMKENKMVEIHIVQTTSCHPMISDSDIADTSEKSIADAIVDTIANRKIKVMQAMENSNGRGWIATNSDIRKAQDLLKKYSTIETTTNGSLALAGLLRALQKDFKPRGTVCVIVSGK